ncbi:hypothetical protein P171DRAFT_434196 [Karstenula rhodostoma CBS 690.94]|uniref:Uncharacterized protein n=1 Tax=Karstenula rhodostoma CBS 690.94 TaxID=1392251 RepID=A0A9P4PCE8_9PLEO|nr:hypothetical protein P171DRAFT_434196 [Karstenula rhodostoma CBS 690.94]
MLAALFRVGLQSILYYGAFSRFTHGQHTPIFHQYQLERAPNTEYTQLIPVFDVALGTLLFSPRARPWAALFFAVAQGGGIIKLLQEGKDVTPDVGLFTVAIIVFLTSWLGDRWKRWVH